VRRLRKALYFAKTPSRDEVWEGHDFTVAGNSLLVRRLRKAF
jgi:hypothetical protein